MTEGHPVFIANNGRIGFDMQDYRQFAPESAMPMQLVWLGVRKSKKTTFAALENLSHDALLKEELGQQFTDFQQRLKTQQHDPQDFYFMPVHPWQWREKSPASLPATSPVAIWFILAKVANSTKYSNRYALSSIFHRHKSAMSKPRFPS